MPAPTGLLQKFFQFAMKHPVQASVPALAGGYILGAKTGNTPEEAGRRALLGAGIAGLALMRVPGVRTAFTNFLKRQVHGVSGAMVGSRALDPTVARTLKQVKGVGKLTEKEKYWLSALAHQTKTNPTELAKELQKYRAGVVTLPQILQGLGKNPAGTIKKGWQLMGPRERLLTLGMGGYGTLQALKNPDPSERAGGIAENLAFMAIPAAPFGVWFPVSLAARKMTSGLGRMLSRNGQQQEELELQLPQVPYKRSVVRYGSRVKVPVKIG